MPPSVEEKIVLLVTGVMLLGMAGEALLSRAHEVALRERGAVEPRNDVYGTMLWAYPTCFLAMGLEGLIRGLPPAVVSLFGLAVVFLAKALKYWAIATLGQRWTFRVLVPPRAELVNRGPYAVMRHPNYVAVIGEFVAMGLLVGAPVTCAACIIGFGTLLVRRIRVEERALGRHVY